MIIGTTQKPVAVARFDRVDDHQRCVQIVHDQLRKQGVQDTSNLVVVIEDDYQDFGNTSLNGNRLLSIALSQRLPGLNLPGSTVH